MRKDLEGRILVKILSYLVGHPCILVIDAWKLDSKKRKRKKTRVTNVYDNWLGEGQVWRGPRNEKRRAIGDVDLNIVIKGRTLLAGDFNAHSPYRNPVCRHKKRAHHLESMINEYGLLINNYVAVAIRYKQKQDHSIINLTITTPDLGYLNAWTIDPNYVTPLATNLYPLISKI